MSNSETIIVDFVAMGRTPDEWKMVLVEEGPWHGSIDEQLKRVQERLYETIDAALEGQLAEKFPETLGKDVIIQLDCYNLPRNDVAKFFDKFSKGVFEAPDYRQALSSSNFVRRVSFEVNFDSIH